MVKPQRTTLMQRFGITWNPIRKYGRLLGWEWSKGIKPWEKK